MRPPMPASAISVWLMLLSMSWAAPPPAAPAAASPDPSATEAAARHAKRTACLKEARVKKLVGADKNAYVKDCLAR